MEFYKDFEVLAIHMVWDHIGRLTANAFLEFATEEEQKKALEAVKKVDDRGKPQPFEHENLANMLSTLYPMIPDQAIVVKMVRLSNSVTEEDVITFFDGMNITGVYLSKNWSGKVTGTGFVAFGSYEDAFRALSKTGSTMQSSTSVGVVITRRQSVQLFASSRGEIMATLPSLFIGVKRNDRNHRRYSYRGHGGRGGYRGSRGGFRRRSRSRGRKRNRDSEITGQPVLKEDLDTEMDLYRHSNIETNVTTEQPTRMNE